MWWKGAFAGAAAGLAASWAMNQVQAAFGYARGHGAQSSKPDDPAVQAAGGDEERARLVHYLFGTSAGAAYGALAEAAPAVTRGMGTAFGAVVWLGADEILLPLVGLSRRPTGYRPSIHAYSLASHLVFGAVAEAGRRAIRRLV